MDGKFVIQITNLIDVYVWITIRLKDSHIGYLTKSETAIQVPKPFRYSESMLELDDKDLKRANNLRTMHTR